MAVANISSLMLQQLQRGTVYIRPTAGERIADGVCHPVIGRTERQRAVVLRDDSFNQ